MNASSWSATLATARTHLPTLRRLVLSVWSAAPSNIQHSEKQAVLLVATWQTLCEAVTQSGASADNCAMEIDVFLTALKYSVERRFDSAALEQMAARAAALDDVSVEDVFQREWPPQQMESVNTTDARAVVGPVDAATNKNDFQPATSNIVKEDDLAVFQLLLEAASVAHADLLALLASTALPDGGNPAVSSEDSEATNAVAEAVASINTAIPADSVAIGMSAANAAAASSSSSASSASAEDSKLALAFSASLARLDTSTSSTAGSHHALANATDDAAAPSPADEVLAALSPAAALLPTMPPSSISNGMRLPDKDCTALMAAARMGHVEVVKLLLGAGATVDQRGGAGETALMIAAACGHEATVRVLVAGGASPNQAARDGGTPLMHGARSGHTGVVRALVQVGAHLDVASVGGDTALMLASAGGYVPTVMVLLEAGALVALARAHDGVTALNLAAMYRHTTVMHLLTDCGAACAFVIDTATSEERRAQLLQQQSARKCVTCTKSLKQGQVKMCAGCKLVPYCSPECQRTDWKRHKQTCKLWQASKASAGQVAMESARAALEANAVAASAASSAAAATAAAAQSIANAKMARLASEKKQLGAIGSTVPEDAKI
jgi:hypothetical protein